jgi:hypothetical protein
MSVRDALSNPETLIVAVGPGGQPGEVIQLRVSMEVAPELSQLLKSEDAFSGFVIQESAEVQQFAALLASFGTGLGGVAAVLHAFFNRHKSRSVTFIHKGEAIEIKGMSQKDTDAVIDRFLESSADQQRKNLEELDYRFPSERDD